MVKLGSLPAAAAAVARLSSRGLLLCSAMAAHLDCVLVQKRGCQALTVLLESGIPSGGDGRGRGSEAEAAGAAAAAAAAAAVRDKTVVVCIAVAEAALKAHADRSMGVPDAAEKLLKAAGR